MNTLKKNNFFFSIPSDCVVLNDQGGVLHGINFNILNKTKTGYLFIYNKKKKNLIALWIFTNFFYTFFWKNHLIFLKNPKEKIAKNFLGGFRQYFYRSLYDFFGFEESVLHFVGVGYKIVKFKRRRKFKIFLWVGFCTWQVLRLRPRTFMMVHKESFRLLSLKIFSQNHVYLSYLKHFIKNIRPSEPYKGKGIRFLDEKIKRKPGKTGRL